MDLSSRISPDDVRFLRNELGSTIGCLRFEAARPEDAVRRIHRDNDCDGVSIGQSGMDPYWIDAALKLLPSRVLRRSAKHTQVVPDPTNLHIRTRRSHTDEVTSIAMMLAAALGANQPLCLAGAIGHDVGHTPLGHFGEQFLTTKVGHPFRHEIFACVAAQHVERSGHGLNLTKQTLCVMRNHSRGGGDLVVGEMSLEEAIVMFADKIAYLFADYNDFIRLEKGGEWINLTPREVKEIHQAMCRLGACQRERVARCVVALCCESAKAGHLSFSRGETFELFEEARRRMYKFYPSNNPSCHGHDLLGAVYDTMAEILPEVNTTVLFAILCDEDLLELSKQIMFRSPTVIKKLLLEELSVSDIVPHLCGVTIDPFDPDLD